jgi:hypothetical protein
VVLFAVHAEVGEREEEGVVIASPVRHRGRFARGIYRVFTGGDGADTAD